MFMRKAAWIASLFLILIAVSANSFSDTLTSTVEQLQKQRQAFAQDSQINLQQLSLDIGAAVRNSAALAQAGRNAQAIAQLKTLNRYAPLERFPSFDVQALCAVLYQRFSDENDAAGCRSRAMAMAWILQRQSGSGLSPDDPVRVITANEIAQWVHSKGANISAVRLYPYHNSDYLQVLTYAGPTTASKPVVAYFQFTPRLIAESGTRNPFDPLPVSPANGKFQIALTQAHEARARFLADTSFDYLELIQRCNDDKHEAMRLVQQGDFTRALSKLREVEQIRPIKDIPISDFISVYSFLLGKTGNRDAQQDAQFYLFGIMQDMAHSGDGLTPQTAIHVVAISEEYAWVGAKRMRATMQRLIREGDRRYDAISAADKNGAVHTYYFDVSQVYARESLSLQQEIHQSQMREKYSGATR